MTYDDKVKLVALAKDSMSKPIGENGMDETILEIIHPGVKDARDLTSKDLGIMMWIQGYLQGKKENGEKPVEDLSTRLSKFLRSKS